MRSKTLPTDITSYDLLKTFAVVTMVIDHVGAYFFPDMVWLRAIGRLSFPVWLFLIGYAQTREITKPILVGSLLLFLSNFVAGMGVFPLSILVTILVVRLLIDKIMPWLLMSRRALWLGAVGLFIIAAPSFILFEFGALAFLFAAFGYLVRRRSDHPDLVGYSVFLGAGYVILQSMGYALYGLEFFMFALGMAGVMAVLLRFRSETYPAYTKALPLAGVKLLHLCGRRTLEIYVLHLLVFKAIVLVFGFPRFGFMQWSWVW